MNWEKTSNTTLESVPRRFVIRSHQYGYYKSYVAEDSLVGGAFAARRGMHSSRKDMLSKALNELKIEVETYAEIF